MAEINLSDLNLEAASPARMIEKAENAYHERVEKIASYIASHQQIKLILLAGPSGSGKTTTANLIADAIEGLGKEALVISLDDFYRDHTDPNYPKNEFGDHDYERPESLNLDKLRSTLCAITENRPFEVPKYDFKLGRSLVVTKHPPIGNGCVIIEGLHALNPIIYENLEKEKILKLFISVSTNVNHDGSRILSGRKMRFLRRLIRDSIYRGSSAERTLKLWHGVLEAEDVYLYPYKSTADLAFDTFHPFELGVMKERAVALLTDELAKKDCYVKLILDAVRLITPINEELVPENSLIREFISGGIYDDIY